MVKDIIVTGSRVYGTPNKDSDWDIVISCDIEDSEKFGHVRDRAMEEKYGIEDSVSLRFEDVNLILCFNEAIFETWKKGTAELKAKAPVDRETAVALFSQLRKDLKVNKTEPNLNNLEID